MSTEAVHPHGDYHSKPGTEVLRIKVEDREGGRMIHSATNGTGDQLVSALGVVLADWIHASAAQHGGNPALELLGMLAAIQNEAAMTLARKLGGGQ